MTYPSSLYDITQEGMELNDILAENGGELTPELEARLDEFLASGKGKIDAACKVVQTLEASAKACYEEASRVTARGDSFDRNSKSLKARILGAIDNAFGGKIKTDLFTVWGQTSGESIGYEVSPDADLASISNHYPGLVRTKYELDKLTLKSMTAQGVALPSAITPVRNPGTRYLRIK